MYKTLLHCSIFISIIVNKSQRLIVSKNLFSSVYFLFAAMKCDDMWIHCLFFDFLIYLIVGKQCQLQNSAGVARKFWREVLNRKISVSLHGIIFDECISCNRYPLFHINSMQLLYIYGFCCSPNLKMHWYLIKLFLRREFSLQNLHCFVFFIEQVYDVAIYTLWFNCFGILVDKPNSLNL